MHERPYELKLASGRRVVWDGVSPEDAIRRFLDCHRGETVVAWRHADRHGLFVGYERIIEPEPGMGKW